MIKFFADTADLSEIQYCFDARVNDGITTNPKIMEMTGDLSGGINATYRRLLNRFPGVPISLETDLRGVDVQGLDQEADKVMAVLLEQANQLAGLGSDVVVKIPICEGGIRAARMLRQKGVRTNVTACMTPYQALAAAASGATFVSLFANRMLDSVILEMALGSLDLLSANGDWKSVVKGHSNLTENAWGRVLEDIATTAEVCDYFGTELIVGSIRSPVDIERIVKARPHIVTIPAGIVKGLSDIPSLKKTSRSVAAKKPGTVVHGLHHPMTLYTIMEFETAADKYRHA